MVNRLILTSYLITGAFCEKKIRKRAPEHSNMEGSSALIFQPRLPVSVQTPQNEMSIFSEVLNQNYTLYSWHWHAEVNGQKEKLFTRIFLWVTSRGLRGKEKRNWPLSHPPKRPCHIEAAIAPRRQEADTDVSLWRSPQAQPTLFTHLSYGWRSSQNHNSTAGGVGSKGKLYLDGLWGKRAFFKFYFSMEK